MKTISKTGGSFEKPEILQQSNNYLENIGYPQAQRARQSALFPLNKTREVARCSSRSRKVVVIGTHTPCKNEDFKG